MSGECDHDEILETANSTNLTVEQKELINECVWNEITMLEYHINGDDQGVEFDAIDQEKVDKLKQVLVDL